MRAFIAFSCLVAIASARPDVSLGYRYPQPGNQYIPPSPGLSVHSSASGLYAPSFSTSGVSSGIVSSGSHPSIVSSSIPGVRFGGSHTVSSSIPGVRFGGSHTVSSGSYPGAIGGSGLFDSSSAYYHGQSGSFGGSTGSFGGSTGSFGPSYNSFGAFGGHHGHQNQYYNQGPIVSKHFHLYTAPEEQQDAVVHKHINIGHAQQHYRVVFIKAPEVQSQSARISASYAPNEEKTVIYVLSKKPDEFKLEDVATPAPTEPSKPEVFFIKYKTQDEAIHAQHTIQSQYDTLGGSSKVSDEGIAPVTSVIGSLGGTTSGVSAGVSTSGLISGHYITREPLTGTSGSHVQHVGAVGPANVYLPG